MSVLLTTPEIKRTLKPASRWRNWWRAKVDGIVSCDVCPRETQRLRGDVFDGCCTPSYASKDLAESAALNNEAPELVEHICALPEGETP